jgi:hypothetical protein
MKTDLSKQYMTHISKINDGYKNGRLISLMDIYKDYGRPPHHSPERVMGYKTFSQIIQREMLKAGMNGDKVIRFQDGDVLVNSEIAYAYIGRLDINNHVIMMPILDAVKLYHSMRQNAV